MRDTHRERGRDIEREAGSMQGARCGTQSCDSRIATPGLRLGLKAVTQPLNHQVSLSP